MNFSKISEAPLYTILSAYRDAAVRHGDATEAGSHREANEAGREIGRLYAELCRRGEDAKREILSFISDSSPGVRLWSASHALDIDSRIGEAALEELVNVGRSLGFSAAVTLKEWRAGRLKFPG